jgi:hypothetical protein
MTKKLFTTLVLALITKTGLFAQLNIQPYGSFVRNLNREYKLDTYGFGLQLELTDASNFGYYLGLAYALPMKTTKQIEARAFCNCTEPSTVDVVALYTLAMYRSEAGVRYYVIGEPDNYSGFNAYVNMALGAILTTNKPAYSYYDKEKYGLGYTSDSDVNEDGSEKLALNPILTAGLGIEKNLGIGNILGQLNIAVPASQAGEHGTSSGIEPFTPIPVNINVGYKISLGGN